MKHLYTIVAEYKGGTYVSQVEAETPTAAVQRWSELKSQGGDDILAEARLEVKEQISAGDAPVPLSGRKNVWCISGAHRDQLILVNAVLTRAQT